MDFRFTDEEEGFRTEVKEFLRKSTRAGMEVTP
jgi:hypothetical protein